MARKSKAATGGQLNVAGILYQMLASLNDGLDATVLTYSGHEGPEPIVLQVEPFDGGDYQVQSRGRVVAQVKIRAPNRRWTPGEIIDDVLRDLFKAVRPRAGDSFQFVTNNDAGCQEFRRFLEWLAAREETDPGDISTTFRLGKNGKGLTGESVVDRIAESLGSESDPTKVRSFLRSFSIELRHRSELVIAINRTLETLVGNREGVRAARKRLIHDLLEASATGRRLTTSDLLEANDLDPRRLLLTTLLPKQLSRKLATACRSLGYLEGDDIRGPLPAPSKPVTIFKAPSGLGKTWRLCATAKAMSEEDSLVLLMRATTDLDTLRRTIAGSVWNPIYSDAVPLASVADHLRGRFADARGVWLTVFLDDLNDAELAHQIIDDDWAAMGIDLVVSSQLATAASVEASGVVLDVVEVPAFTIEELIRYLERRDISYAELPDEVLDLLFKPVLARLYCLLPEGVQVKAETEYELMNSVWTFAATGRADHIRHPFDLDRLQLVVGDMLADPPSYPLPPAAFVRTMDDATVQRLIETGIVELDGDRRLSITHDRLLNWAMASQLDSASYHQGLSAGALLNLFRRLEDLRTSTGVNIGRRFGYVLLDLLWLMLRPGRSSPANAAAFLLAYMRAEGFDAYNRDFFRGSLATLGSRAVPLLTAMTEAGFSGDLEDLWPAWTAEALRKVADDAWDAVRDAATDLYRSGEPARVEVALRVLGKVGAPELVEELFAATMQRKAEMDAAIDDQRMEAIYAKERAFDAFARAAEQAPDWFDERIAASTSPVECGQLLWALVTFDREIGLPIWRKRRDHLFSTITDGERVLPRAVRTFVEPTDLERLHLITADGADHMWNAVTFDAIARLDPSRAVAILESDEGAEVNLNLLGTDGWWMPGLHLREGPDALGTALRRRAQRANPEHGANQIARHYSGATSMIDVESVDLILNALEAILLEVGSNDEDMMRRSYWLLTVLSSLQSVATLQRVAARAGGELERELANLACRRPASSSRIADREGEMIARVLAIMAGDGFERLTLAEISSDGRTTAEYGFGHALWTTSEAVGASLENLALDRADQDDDRPYYLMQALAAHGRDRGLARLIDDSSPVYTNAINIRQAREGDPSGLLAEIVAKIASSDKADHIKAVDLSHFLNADTSIAVTQPLLATAQPGDEVSVRLLNQHFHRGRYDPILLSKLLPFLSSAADPAPRVVQHLANYGDDAARAEAVKWLSGPGASAGRQNVQAAFALLDHTDSREGAIAFLSRLRDTTGLGRLGADILQVLADNGDRGAQEQLGQLAFGGKSQDLDAVAGAVRKASAGNTYGAFQAARRLFSKSGQIEAARIVVQADANEGVAELLRAYPGSNQPKRLAISRILRWHAPPEALLPRLSTLAASKLAGDRKMAAEIAGWIDHNVDLEWLRGLAEDPVQAVEEAAISSLRGRAQSGAASGMIAAIPHISKPRQWAFMRALIDMQDPHLLRHSGDPIEIRKAISGLPVEFGVEAQRLLDRRQQEVDRKERDAARKEE